MAKDPAFLFYPGDWQGGTSTMTRHLKGCYIDLLIAQFNSGPLSLEEIRNILGNDFAAWQGSLAKKFKQDSRGLFFNERLETEKDRRKKFKEKQTENGKKGGRPKNPNKTQPETQTKAIIENENENALFESRGAGGANFFPGSESIDMELPEIKIGAVIQLLAITKKKVVTNKDVLGLWEVFKTQNFTGKKFIDDPYNYFINWCGGKKIETDQRNIKPGTSEARTERNASWGLAGEKIH